MAEMTTIARPYARAAFEQAAAAGGLEAWSDVLQAAALVVTDEAVRPLLGNPQFTQQEKVDLLLGVCEQATGVTVPAAARNFITLLATNGRLAALPQIHLIFDKLRADAEKTVDAQLTTAFPASDAERDAIAQALAGRLKRRVALQCAVDASLIGGAVIRAGDLVIDGSVRGQLQKLASALHQTRG